MEIGAFLLYNFYTVMIEIITEAIVLDKEDLGEQDSRVFLYTKELGKVIAKATSARRITSKLAAHLEPLNHAEVRLISKSDFLDGKGFQVADAVLTDNSGELKSNPELLSRASAVFSLIKKSIPEAVPEPELWNFLEAIRNCKAVPAVAEALALLGFNVQFSACELCDRFQPEYFFPVNNFFVCRGCKMNSKEKREDFIKVL